MQFKPSAERSAVIGGFGAQTLRGGAGDDLIYGDQEGDGRLLALDEDRDGGAGAYLGPAQAAGVHHAGAARFFAAGAETGAGGVGGWTAQGDALVPVWSLSARVYDTQDLLTGARAVHAFAWDGAAYLVTGGAGVSLSRLDAGGAPELLNTRFAGWGDGLLQPGAFASFEHDGALHLLVGGGWEGGLTVLRWDAFGLRIVSRLADSRQTRLAGVSDIETIELGGTLYALTASFADGGLGVYAIDGVSPGLADQRHAGDGETGFDLADAVAVEAVRAAGGGAFVYAASENGRLISYALDASGALTRLADRGGAHDLAHVRIAGRDWLLSVEGGREVHVFAVEQDGALRRVETLVLEPGARAVSLAAVAEGDRARILVGRDDADGYDLLNFRPEGDDVISGGAGDDEILGGAGEDRLDGGPGDDALLGEADADLLLGGDGGDRLWGGGGDDRLDGGAGDDALLGAADADLLLGRDGDDQLWGGAGDDRLEGGAGADSLRGEDGDDRLYGGDETDALFGEAGRDRLEGGAGDDSLSGGADGDVLLGGDGDDAISGGPDADVLDGGAGADRLAGDAADDALSGGGQDDVLQGGDGDDLLDGGEGDDDLRGDAGVDRLLGAAGDDRLSGGEGNDDLAGGDGRDRLTGDGGDDALRGERGVDRLVGGAGRDALYGGGGRDRLDGGGGVDVLRGGGGKDDLRGGGGGDRLEGGGGRDRLDGGGGRDALVGGAGRDVFVFARKGVDRVVDFGRGDKLEFARADGFEALRIRDLGDDALVIHGGVRALLEDVDADALGRADFIF